MKETKNIKHFLSNIANKNYSNANTALQQIIEDKLRQRINSTLQEGTKNKTSKDK